MKIQNYLITLFFFTGLIILLNACKKDNAEPGDDNAPELLLNGADIYEDTIKMTINPEIDIPFTISDDLNTHQLSMSKLDGAIVYYNGEVLNNTTVELSGVTTGSIRFRALDEGVHSFFLNLEDEKGLTITVLVEITALGNLEPEAVVRAEQLNEVADYHVRFDASESFDRDGPWGGAIMSYEFDLIGFYKVETERSELDYIYPEPGTYTLDLRVKDNDGVWSETERTVIEVE